MFQCNYSSNDMLYNKILLLVLVGWYCMHIKVNCKRWHQDMLTKRSPWYEDFFTMIGYYGNN